MIHKKSKIDWIFYEIYFYIDFLNIFIYLFYYNKLLIK